MRRKYMFSWVRFFSKSIYLFSNFTSEYIKKPLKIKECRLKSKSMCFGEKRGLLANFGHFLAGGRIFAPYLVFYIC